MDETFDNSATKLKKQYAAPASTWMHLFESDCVNWWALIHLSFFTQQVHTKAITKDLCVVTKKERKKGIQNPVPNVVIVSRKSISLFTCADEHHSTLTSPSCRQWSQQANITMLDTGCDVEALHSSSNKAGKTAGYIRELISLVCIFLKTHREKNDLQSCNMAISSSLLKDANV